MDKMERLKSEMDKIQAQIDLFESILGDEDLPAKCKRDALMNLLKAELCCLTKEYETLEEREKQKKEDLEKLNRLEYDFNRNLDDIHLLSNSGIWEYQEDENCEMVDGNELDVDGTGKDLTKENIDKFIDEMLLKIDGVKRDIKEDPHDKEIKNGEDPAGFMQQLQDVVPREGSPIENNQKFKDSELRKLVEKNINDEFIRKLVEESLEEACCESESCSDISYGSIHSSQCEVYDSTYGSDLMDETCDVYDPEHDTERNKKLSEMDFLIQELASKIIDTDAKVEAARQENKSLRKKISKTHNERRPLFNSLLKDFAPMNLNDNAFEKYTKDLERLAKKYGVEMPKGQDCESFDFKSPMNVAEKYYLFNRCVEAAYPNLTFAPRPCKSEPPSGVESCCKHTMDSQDIYHSHWELLKELDRKQEETLQELKTEYDALLEAFKQGVRDRVETDLAKESHVQSLTQAIAFKEAECLVLDTEIGELQTEILLKRGRVDFLVGKQKQLCAKLHKAIACSERALQKEGELQSELCECEQKHVEFEESIQCFCNLVCCAEEKLRTTEKSIKPLDDEIKMLIHHLYTLKKNRCRQRGCRSELIARRIEQMQSAEEAAILEHKRQEEDDPFDVDVEQLVADLALQVKYEEIEDELDAPNKLDELKTVAQAEESGDGKKYLITENEDQDDEREEKDDEPLSFGQLFVF